MAGRENREPGREGNSSLVRFATDGIQRSILHQIVAASEFSPNEMP
jgi:hypothetical protein